MDKEQLIKRLMDHDLNQFTFTVWSRQNEETLEKEYTMCLGNSIDEGFDNYEGKIGGHYLEDGVWDEETIDSTIFGY
ncbi:hypothetical protein KPL26_02990 [Clostridium algidicarnis]|uniref:hypothetical protein n=1 Tax=Clostridium algidicarnis TaxID=37659 RepID=UPI001C0E60C3|nr:hypothetical protein [Clostridium algidicarnis]MBU3195630.1 hypothetical protein [Clostridium algidicarnis]